jgi:hypothetical protein
MTLEGVRGNLYEISFFIFAQRKQNSIFQEMFRNMRQSALRVVADTIAGSFPFLQLAAGNFSRGFSASEIWMCYICPGQGCFLLSALGSLLAGVDGN